MSYPGADFDLQWQQALAPEDYENPTPDGRYHLVVIGAGPAGLISAIGAAGLGAKVALIERHRMGGDCLNVGCVPSKALLEYTAHQAKPDFDGAFAWLREVRASIAPHDSVQRYSELGVDVYLGEARFLDHHAVEVGGQRLEGRRLAICTGAAPGVPPIPGLREANPLTNETVFDLREKPNSIGILGAGAIGCELSQVFARLGVEVHLFEMADRVLPLEGEEASAALAASMEALGVHLHLGAAVESVAGGAPHTIHAAGVDYAVDQVMVALGRRPNTDGLSLKLAGIEVDQRGLIRVDEKLRTTNRHVYAAGDCASALQFTHHADAQARVIVQNALFLPSASTAGFVVPHCTYTQPEVASVGESVASLESAGKTFDRYRIGFEELDRGRAELGDSGFAEVYTEKGSDKILGATIVGPDAGEQLAPICLLISQGLGLAAVQKTMLSYPTRSEYLKRLSDAYNRTRLTPMASKVIAAWMRFTSA